MERTVVITGAGRGIGREIAMTAARKGDFPIVIDIYSDLAAETEKLVKASGARCLSYAADLTKPDLVRQTFEAIFGETKRIDALVNNAGYYVVPNSIEELTVEFWDRMIEANMKTAFLCSLEAFKYMKTANHGKIVNITSSAVFSGYTGMAPYIASKAGVIGLTRAFAKDMGPYNITVNAVAAGLTETAYALQMMGRDRFEKTRDLKAIKKDETPADLMGAIFFCIDPASDHMTGQTLIVDGGREFV